MRAHRTISAIVGGKPNGADGVPCPICGGLPDNAGFACGQVACCVFQSITQQAAPKPSFARACPLWSATRAPVERAIYEPWVTAVRSGLDEARVAAAGVEGRTMALEQAIACALEGGHEVRVPEQRTCKDGDVEGGTPTRTGVARLLFQLVEKLVGCHSHARTEHEPTVMRLRYSREFAVEARPITGGMFFNSCSCP